MRVCSNCGKVYNDGSKFCVSCGGEIIEKESINNAAQNDQGVNNYQNTMNQGQQFNAPNGGMNQTNPQMNSAFGQPNYYGSQGNNEVQKCRCKNCKTVFPSNMGACPNCNSNNIDYKPDLWMGILSLVFGVLGGWLGIVFGILGIRSANKTGYKQLKTMSIVGLIVCVISMIVWTGIMNS